MRSHNSFFIVIFAFGKHKILHSTVNSKIRIKDIAERAGVSVGTVDRVLHKRPNVSAEALKKVETALAEMNYQPNVYASALASNKSYDFYLLLPKHESEAYWAEVEDGAMHARDNIRDFKVQVNTLYYDRFAYDTFEKVCEQCIENQADGVIIVPSTLDVTRKYTDQLQERQIPFVLLDSYMPDLKPLAFYGQDSFASGRFAARMLSFIARGEKEIMILKLTNKGRVASKQQANREMGFRNYLQDHYPHVKITELELPINGDKNLYDKALEVFFENHPNIHHCITFSSKAHIVGNFLLRTNRRKVQIMGYDMVEKNAECMRQGSVSFLIAQHGYMQGYNCVDALFRAIILKKEVNPVNYMPIELLTPENLEFYQRTQV